MDIDKIRDYIAAQTDLTVGTDLFSYSMPSAIDKGVGVLLDDSYSDVDHEIPGLYRNRFQVIVRDPDFVTGKARADEIFTLLRMESRHDFGTFTTRYIRPAHLPFHYPRSGSDQIEFSVNFDTSYIQS